MFFKHCTHYSVLGIAQSVSLLAMGWRTRGTNPGMGQILSLLQTSCGAHPGFYAIGAIVLSRELKWPGREFNGHLQLGPRYTCTPPPCSVATVRIHIIAGKSPRTQLAKWPTTVYSYDSMTMCHHNSSQARGCLFTLLLV